MSWNWIRLFWTILLLTGLVACSLTEPEPEPVNSLAPDPRPSPEPTSTLEPTHTPLPTDTPQPTSTPSSTPLPTATPPPPDASLEGILFLDANGSGLQDQASFVCPDEAEKIESLIYFFPDAAICTPGTIVTVMEPGLAGMIVSANSSERSSSSTTDATGFYRVLIPYAEDGERLTLTVHDPNAGNPAIEMRHTSIWIRSVTIPAGNVKGTDIPEQNLNETRVALLKRGYSAVIGQENSTGLMQGYLTLPFIQSAPEPYSNQANPSPFVWNYYDIFHDQQICADKPYAHDGPSLDYRGLYTDRSNDATYSTAGAGDAHTGLDYSVPIGKFVAHGAPDSIVWYLPEEDELRVHTYTTVGGIKIRNTYGHNSVQLVKHGQKVRRGEIIALTGQSGGGIDILTGVMNPQLHFDLSIFAERDDSHIGCDNYTDPFRTIIDPPNIQPYSGNPVSMWTVDNLPFFPLTHIISHN